MDNKLIMQSSVLFLTLDVFKSTGGIQRACRTFCKVLMDIDDSHCQKNKILSLYDHKDEFDHRYTTSSYFKGFNNNKILFLLEALRSVGRHQVVVISHVNLLSIAIFIKILHPYKRIVLIAHGIEVWKSLSPVKRYFLQGMEIWCVSQYTRDEVKRIHNVYSGQLIVLNNCLDPFFTIPENFEKSGRLLKRHKLAFDQPIILTITRITPYEKLKGYFSVLNIIPDLLHEFPDLHYFLAGNADVQEKESINWVIKELKIEPFVTLLGFIEETELTAYYRLSDVFIMPSSKEGFGLVFLEAAACGCKIIAGNKDGSKDAVIDGILIDPYDHSEIKKSLQSALRSERNDSRSLQIQQACLNKFSYEVYKGKVKTVLENWI
jgi:phosphatidylinositol alpha-1,6-mannosyltransferase